MPCEFVRYFDPRRAVLVGGLAAGEENFGFIQARPAPPATPAPVCACLRARVCARLRVRGAASLGSKGAPMEQVNNSEWE